MLKKLFPFKIFRTVEYFGNKIKLRRMYFDVTSYALDSENISMDEAYRLESIMKSVPFGPVFKSKQELLNSFVEIRFPGYGSFYANQLNSNPDQNLELMTVDIPRAEKYRYFVVEEKANGSFSVVADFTAEAHGVVKVRAQGNSFEFLSRSDEVVLVHIRSSIP
jgi:hypothetical protein